MGARLVVCKSDCCRIYSEVVYVALFFSHHGGGFFAVDALEVLVYIFCAVVGVQAISSVSFFFCNLTLEVRAKKEA